MVNVTANGVWERLLKEDSKLKKLAIAAGVQDKPERAQELGESIAWNFGEGVISNDAEKELATYLFCMSDLDSIKKSLSGRMIMAKAVGEHEDVAVIQGMLSELD